MDKSLKAKLNQIKIPAYEDDALIKTIQAAKEMDFQPGKYRMTACEFFVDQIRFVQRKTWASKTVLTILLLVLLGLTGISLDYWTWPLVSIAAPFACLLNVNELFQALQPGIYELQMTTRFSLRKILLVRLILFGLIDLVLLVPASVLLIASYGAVFWQVLLYSTVPYNLMCFGCFAILNHCREENALLYCAGFAVLLNCIVIMCRITGLELFADNLAFVWIIAEALALTGTGLELRSLLLKGEGNVYEINTGSAV